MAWPMPQISAEVYAALMSNEVPLTRGKPAFPTAETTIPKVIVANPFE